MGLDSRGVYRGECTHPGCQCREFQRSSGTSKCYVCSHPPANHIDKASPRQPAVGSDKRTRPTPVAPPVADRGAVSHTTAPSGGHSTWESYSSQLYHHNHPSSWEVSGELSGWKVCHTCGTGYSPIDLGACPKCCPREACKSGCGKPAFYSLELGSFGYCGAECRDKCELKGARREVARALKEFEMNPGGVSSQAAAKETVNHTALAQPSTRSRLQSNDMPITLGATPEAPPTQQSPPPPPPKATVRYHHCQMSLDVIRAMSLYDSGKLQTVNGTKGILVTSIEVNKETLACGIQPLDLITQFDGQRAEILGNTSGCCSLYVKMTKTIADVRIARMSLLPTMSDLQSLVQPHQSSRKYRIVGFLVTQKELVDPASFLGILMDGHSNGRKVDRVPVLSVGNKAGLRENDIIQSVTLVTEDGGVHGPDTEWSFDKISKTAKNSPSVFALLMTVMNF